MGWGNAATIVRGNDLLLNMYPKEEGDKVHPDVRLQHVVPNARTYTFTVKKGKHERQAGLVNKKKENLTKTKDRPKVRACPLG